MEKITWKDLQGKSGKISLSDGNKKLVSDEYTRFLIFSIPAVKTCPFATEHCKASCYAVKAERAYPDCLPAREKNLAFTKTDEFVPFMVKALHYIAGLKAYRKAEHITVRIHESGDFYSYEYLKKWLDIADACRDIKNMDFAAYTKSIPYLMKAKKEGYNVSDCKACNIRFTSSIWDDTKAVYIAETEVLDLPIYTAFEKESWDESYTKCECKDCGHCRHCFAGADACHRNAVVIH